MMATLRTPFLLRTCCTRSLLRHFSQKTSLRQFAPLQPRKTASREMREFPVGPRAKAKREAAADIGFDDGPASHASDRVSLLFFAPRLWGLDAELEPS
jgi:hypothetical protein